MHSIFEALLAKRRAQAEVEAQLVVGREQWGADLHNGAAPLKRIGTDAGALTGGGAGAAAAAHAHGGRTANPNRSRWSSLTAAFDSGAWREKLAKFELEFEMQNLRVLCALGQGAFGKVELAMHRVGIVVWRAPHMALSRRARGALRFARWRAPPRWPRAAPACGRALSTRVPHVRRVGCSVPATQVMHTQTSKLYALKAQKIQKLDAILREEQAMAECRCPFVMGFFGASQQGPMSYLLTEFMSGGDLKQLMDAKTTLPPSEARFYFACVVEAFEKMHSKDWMHRDLKLENLMIGNNGYAKVIDLGLAKQLASGHAYTMCGTPVYMSPEIVKGTGYFKAADVWALGVLLHEMISGTPPFWPENEGGANRSRDLMYLFELIVKAEPKLAHAGFSPQSKDLIVGMLAKKPTARLGCLAGSFDDVKAHPFFADFDWYALEAQRMPPPFVPAIADAHQEERRSNMRKISTEKESGPFSRK